MKKFLLPLLAAALCGLPCLPAFADPSPRADSVPSATTLPAIAVITMRAPPMLLDDEALDGVHAAGIGASAYGFASADRGRVLSTSTTQLVSSRMVTFSLSQSLAFAIGLHPSTSTGATARSF